ncbi:hypothetical protein Hesp01_18640 [Herbidospora sp. NBRC 101105]|nr:hypothetical protein Hesp01_18640 [Herbidospora sp. NBRC 101105]
MTAAIRPARLGQPFTRRSIRKLAACLPRLPGRPLVIIREALHPPESWIDFEAKLDRIEHALSRRPEQTATAAAPRRRRASAGRRGRPREGLCHTQGKL